MDKYQEKYGVEKEDCCVPHLAADTSYEADENAPLVDPPVNSWLRKVGLLGFEGTGGWLARAQGFQKCLQVPSPPLAGTYMCIVI